MENRKPMVTVLIPTYRPDKKFARLLQMLGKQTYEVRKIIVMNTEPSYWNEDGYEGIRGLEVHHIKKEAFDHGGTRRLGMKYVRTEIAIWMTQDAVPADEYLIEKLVDGLQQTLDRPEPVAAAYARQLPEKTCRYLERYTRSFNYPSLSRVKVEEDLPTLGIKTYFCSNVCAAYNMNVYQRLDGFVPRAIFNEDMIYASDVISAGYGIAYVAEAKVIHSHNYSWKQQFKRNFDLAVSQANHPEIFADISSEGEGIRMVKATIQYLKKQKKVYLIPELIGVSASKYIGYFLGKHYKMLPLNWICACSLNPTYWNQGKR